MLHTFKVKLNLQSILTRLNVDILFNAGFSVLAVVLSGILIFLLPKYISMEEYASFRMYMVLGVFAGVSAFGISEGMLQNWVRGRINDYSNTIAFVIVEQIIVGIALCVVSHFSELGWSWVIVWLGPMFIATNLYLLGVAVLEATRRFKTVAVLNFSRHALFCVLALLLIVVGLRTGLWLILANIMATATMAFMAIITTRKSLIDSLSLRHFVWRGVRRIKLSLGILWSRIAYDLDTVLDTTIVSILLPIGDLAIYAFAASISLAAHTVSWAISRVLFPYFAQLSASQLVRQYKNMRNWTLAISSLLLLCLPMIVWIVNNYLPLFVASLPLILVLLFSVVANNIVQLAQVTYYKAKNMQKALFSTNFGFIIVSIILNIALLQIWPAPITVALITLGANILLAIVNEIIIRRSMN